MIALEKLLSIASPEISEGIEFDGRFPEDLKRLLKARNGFYAFESALYFRPIRSSGQHIGIIEWNEPGLWIGDYGFETAPFCFAEDVFGCQFGFLNEEIVNLDPETGTLSKVANNLESLATQILEDWRVLTGHAIARAWQTEHGPLGPEERLVPKTPFVLGGAFDLENLYAIDSVQGMKQRASFANQIRDFPDGTKVSLRVAD